MDYALFIYLANLSGSLNTVLAIFGFIGAFLFAFGTVAAYMIHLEDHVPATLYKTCRAWFFASLASILISCFIPSERLIYMMVGASIVQDIAENPRTQSIGERLITLMETKLDEAIGPREEETANDH